MALGGEGNAVKLRIEDFYIFEFDAEFNLVDIEIIDKFKSSFSFPGAFFSPQLIAMAAKSYGAFDYSFTQRFNDRPMFTLGYTDYERRKKEKNTIVFGAATHDGESYTMDKINLQTKSGEYIRLMQAKLGHILIAEYLPKEKRMEWRLEKINY